MKTSNYIFLSFLIFLFSGIIALYVGSKYYYENLKFLIKVKKTASFSVIVAEPGAVLVLKNGNEFRVSQSYRKGSVPDFASFEVRNDTLFMSAVQSKIDGKWFIVPEVYCKNVKSIIAKEKTNINLKNYQTDSLYIKLNKSDFFWTLKKTNFVSINAKDSYLHLYEGNIHKMNVDLDKTGLWLESENKTREISGRLTNKSQVNGSVNGKISLDVDQSSKLHIYNSLK